MRSFGFSVVQAAALSALMVGCADDGGLCPRPKGNYVGSYRPVSGNCTNVKSRDLLIEDGREGSMGMGTITLSDSVWTEVNLIGCTVAVEQSISKERTLMAKLAGNLEVEDARTLSGRLTYQEFLPDGMTQSCFSEVEVSYVQQGSVAGGVPGGGAVTIGAAAEAALQSP